MGGLGPAWPLSLLSPAEGEKRNKVTPQDSSEDTSLSQPLGWEQGSTGDSQWEPRFWTSLLPPQGSSWQDVPSISVSIALSSP